MKFEDCQGFGRLVRRERCNRFCMGDIVLRLFSGIVIVLDKYRTGNPVSRSSRWLAFFLLYS